MIQKYFARVSVEKLIDYVYVKRYVNLDECLKTSDISEGVDDDFNSNLRIVY